ncbi:MAG: hypothetical protein HQK76_13030 [Desulfobacterales bacterium]|nr:hypothetical protein [Desulfobacterales bacterium]
MLDHNAVFNLKQKRLNQIIGEVKNRLYEKKTKQIISYNLQKAIDDIDFLQDRIPPLRIQLNEITKELEALEIKNAEAKSSMSILIEERKVYEAEYSRQSNIDIEIKEKSLKLPKLKAEILNTKETIKNFNEILNNLDLNHKNMLQKREDILNKNKNVEQRIKILLKEIPIMIETRDLLMGILPKNVKPENFEEVLGHFKVYIELHTSEMKKEIQHVTSQINELKTSLDREYQTEQSFISQRLELEKKIRDLNIDESIDKASLISEIKNLEDKNKIIDKNIPQIKIEIEKNKSEIKAVEEKIRNSQDRQNELNKKINELELLKNEMNSDELSAEIQRLNTNIKEYNISSDINQKMLEMINNIKNGLSSINKDLNESVTEYAKNLNEIEKKIIA